MSNAPSLFTADAERYNRSFTTIKNQYHCITTSVCLSSVFRKKAPKKPRRERRLGLVMVINEVTNGHKTEGVKAMEQREKNNNHVDMSRRVPSRPSFTEILDAVKEQVDYDSFAETRTGRSGQPWTYLDPLYFNICRIIADMYVKPPDTPVKIEGAWITAAIVQERYRELDHDHIRHVVEKFKAQTGLIQKLKPYLQNMLFNVLDEFDAYYTNLVNHDMYGGGRG
jgi:hypothetical protein